MGGEKGDGIDLVYRYFVRDDFDMGIEAVCQLQLACFGRVERTCV